MTQAVVTRTIKAVIKGKTEKEGTRGQYLAIQLLRHGMRYPETYNCWDMKQLEHVKLNEPVSLILHRDGVKADKEDDGQDGSYWWSIAGVTDISATSEIPPPPSKPSESTQEESPESYQDIVQYRIQLGMAFNTAVELIAAHTPPLWADGTYSQIRQLRDRLLHEVILVPVAPPHYCYVHEAQRVRSGRTGKWGHILEDQSPCVEGDYANDGTSEEEAYT